MSVKPIEKKKGLSIGANFRIIFLVLAVAAGVFLNTFRSPSMVSKKEPLTILRPQAVDIKKDMTNIAQSAATEAQKSATDVLGEASKVVQTTVDKTKEDVADSVFKNTFIAFIQNAIDKLPPRQRKETLQELCK